MKRFILGMLSFFPSLPPSVSLSPSRPLALSSIQQNYRTVLGPWKSPGARKRTARLGRQRSGRQRPKGSDSPEIQHVRLAQLSRYVGTLCLPRYSLAPSGTLWHPVAQEVRWWAALGVRSQAVLVTSHRRGPAAFTCARRRLIRGR